MKLAANIVLFQLGWFACVLGAANDRPWLGPVVVAGVVAWHLFAAKRPAAELALVAAVTAAGAAFETLLVQGGWTRFDNGAPAEGFPAVWMVALWALFATTLNVSLRWMRERPALAAAFGLIGGPLAYAGGARLGAFDIGGTAALVAIGIGWAIATPAVLALARRCDGTASA